MANKVKTSKGSENSFPAETAADEFFSRLTASDIPIPITNFSDFVQDIFSKGYPEFSFNTWHIHYLCNQFQKVLDEPDSKYMLAVMPRYHLKSSILGYASSIYRMITSSGEGLYVSYKEELAGIHLFHIKECVRKNEQLSKFMKDLTPQSDTTINYMVGKKRSKMYSAGILGVKRGLHTQTICLQPGTLVLVAPNVRKKSAGGYRAISEIQNGDKVKTHLNRYKTVTNVFSRDVSEEIIVLYLSNGEIIKITSNHPILTKKDGWKNAGSLTTEDILMKLKFYDSKLKDRKYEDIHGEDKAKLLKKEKFKNIDRSKQNHSSVSKNRKNKTYEEIYGSEKAIEIREKIKGEKKAREIRKCLVCSDAFEVIISSKKIFCSVGCSNKFHKNGMGFNFRSKIGNFVGANNPNWKGGSVYPAVFNSSLKYKIFSRDGFICQKCGKYGGILNCHHIDYDKNNCTDTNLITTCRACNFSVNNNRNYWKNYFSAKIAVKYALITNGTEILKIEKEFYSGKVCNLEVEDDNSYIGKGLIYHNCICDDLMGDLQNPMTFTEIEKTIRVFEAELLNIPNKGCPLLVFGTVISEHDLLYRLKEKPQFNKNMVWMPALYPDAEHEVLWEAMYPRAWLENRKNEGGWKAFNTEFLLIPVMSTEAFFNKDQLDTVISKDIPNYGVPGY